jgi:subtilisin
MRIILSIFFAAALFGCSKNDSGQPTGNEDPGCTVGRSAQGSDIIGGRYIIAYNASAAGQRMASRSARSFDENIAERNQVSPSSLLASFDGGNGGFIARLSASELSRLQADDAIAIIEPDRVVSLGACFTIAEPRLITWNINRVGFGNGIGKTAWVIDTGIDFDHADLTVDVNKSRSFLSGQGSADDENGHGTHVAGIIAAKNNTIGVLGVASGATLVSLRVLDKDGQGTVSGIIQALSYVSANAKAGDAVNMSVGSEEGISAILDQQVLSTAAKGIFIAMAAGNDAKAANLYSPGRVNGNNVYTVSAIDSLNRFASFSNFGNDVVDFAAPGVYIRSTFKNNQYAIMSGTSMATPHVTGLLLLKGNAIASGGTALNDPDGVADKIAHY